MEVTAVKIRKLSDNGRMKAILSLTFNEQFVVHDVRIIEGSKGLFVAMPSKKTPGGDFRDIAHPINITARKEIEKAVFDAYREELREMNRLEY